MRCPDLTAEVVERFLSWSKPKADVKRELGLVQVLGRLALWSAILSVAGLTPQISATEVFPVAAEIRLPPYGAMRSRLIERA